MSSLHMGSLLRAHNSTVKHLLTLLFLQQVISTCILLVSIKIFLKRNLSDVGMAQCMDALADKVHKQEVPHTHSDMQHGHVIQQPSLQK